MSELTDEQRTAENTEGSKPPKQGSSSNLWGDLIALVLKIAWIGFFIFAAYMFVVGVMIQSGTSMAPAVHDRDFALYYRLANDIQAKDLVVYQAEQSKLRVGRVVAVAGDTVDIDENGLMINGYYQTEAYRSGETVLFEGGPSFPILLKNGEYFILCDDRSQGDDSRILGPIQKKNIKGRIMLLLRDRDF